MSEQAVYDIKLPPKVAIMLRGMVDLAEKQQVLTLTCNQSFSIEGPNLVDYQITAGDTTEVFQQDLSDVLFGLNALELIYYTENKSSYKIFLTHRAYAWFQYNRKNGLGRFIYRYWPGWKYIIQGIFGALIAIIPALWVFLELLYYWGLLQKKP